MTTAACALVLPVRPAAVTATGIVVMTDRMTEEKTDGMTAGTIAETTDGMIAGMTAETTDEAVIKF